MAAASPGGRPDAYWENKLESALDPDLPSTAVMDGGEPGVAPRAAYEAFMAFPIPLALADGAGLIQLVNGRFRERYPLVAPEPRALVAAGRNAGNMWQRVIMPMTADDHQGVPARVIQSEGHILLAVDDPSVVAPLDELMALRDRIGALERLAAADHLTDAWNRTHFIRIIAAELGRSTTLTLPLSVLLLDIDHFRRCVEQFGHGAAGTVLRELVGVVRARLRPTDLLFRWEREQFAVLLWATDGQHAEVVAESLRSLVADHIFSVGARVTVSVGVAEHARDETFEEWFSRVEGALYDAKAGGRNRVVHDVLEPGQRPGRPDAPHAGTRLEWGADWASGATELDAEHRALFELANVLIDAAHRPGASLDSVAVPLDALTEHTRTHFSHEERLMHDLRYERAAEHRRVHAALLARADHLRKDVAAGRLPLMTLVDYLAGDVIAHHIQSVDRAYYPLFAAGHAG